MSVDLNNQEKLEEVYQMTLENNQILRSMRKEQHIATAFRFIYWLVILGAVGGAYLYVRPVIQAVSDNKTKFQQALEQFNQLRSQLPGSGLFNNATHGSSSPTTSTTTSSQ
jgi:hypothetical protein